MQTARSDRPGWRSRRWMPAFSLFLGALMFTAFAIGGDAALAVLLLRRRSQRPAALPSSACPSD